jgi:hypothetical protein
MIMNLKKKKDKKGKKILLCPISSYYVAIMPTVFVK